MKPTKEEVSRQFSRTAHAYATSVGHAAGSDLAILLQLLKPESHMRVLDVATGAGHTACAVAPFVKSVVASDLVPAMIDETKALIGKKNLTNVTAVVMDVEALDFPDASFDAVTVRIAPHHFINIQQAVDEIARVPKPGGVFVLEDSYAPESKRLDNWINDIERMRDHTHVRSYSKREWKEMLLKAGLKVVRCRNYRKTHDVPDWVKRSDLSQPEQDAVFTAFAEAPHWARTHFKIQYADGQATSFTDDKVILRAVKC